MVDKATGISASSLSGMENGKENDRPSLDRALTLATYYDVDVDYILHGGPVDDGKREWVALLGVL